MPTVQKLFDELSIIHLKFYLVIESSKQFAKIYLSKSAVIEFVKIFPIKLLSCTVATENHNA